jgi:hypothetical protein
MKALAYTALEIFGIDKNSKGFIQINPLPFDKLLYNATLVTLLLPSLRSFRSAYLSGSAW